MIRSFKDRETEGVFGRERGARRLPPDILRTGHRKLRQLHVSADLDDLRAPPGNRLESLTGDRKGQYSIRINDQWRICFEWRDGDAFDVEIVDYHSRGRFAMPKAFGPVHPGEHLAKDFLGPLGISQSRLASDLGVPFRRINEIVLGKRGITAETALLLARYFGTSAEFWLRLQADYDIEVARERIGEQLARVRVHRDG